FCRHYKHQWGSNTVRYASCGIKQPRQMRRPMLSNRFTTNWDEILKVKASFPIKFDSEAST
ncbi:MAG TPA: DUF4113 domain-containing protein, partial [Thermodesulfobacteriota bacterium]|nr:DUF4113 domain-containing protein [Thermodesulfobacteriota bacterium]